MRKKMICTLAATLIVSATAAFGAVKEGSFSVTPLIGGYIFDGGTYLDPTLVLGIRGGTTFPSISESKPCMITPLPQMVNTDL